MKYFTSYKNSGPNKLLVLVISGLIAISCNPTKYIADGESLLDRSDIKIDDIGVKKSDLVPYIKQVPNKRIFGTRFHLGLYNLSNLEKDGWPHGWLRNIGEEPVVFDPFATTKTAEQLDNYLFYKGYFNADVTADLSTRKKRTNVVYNIDSHQPYKIRDIRYQVEDTSIRKLIYMDTINRVFDSGQLYDIDELDGERQRLQRFVRDLGYFKFSSENINFEGDTAVGNHQVDIDIQVSKQRNIDYNGIIRMEPHHRYRIRNIYIYPDFDPRAALSVGENYSSSLDTTEYKGFYFRGSNGSAYGRDRRIRGEDSKKRVRL